VVLGLGALQPRARIGRRSSGPLAVPVGRAVHPDEESLMLIGVPKETHPGEWLVAATPRTVAQLTKPGYEAVETCRMRPCHRARTNGSVGRAEQVCRASAGGRCSFRRCRPRRNEFKSSRSQAWGRGPGTFVTSTSPEVKVCWSRGSNLGCDGGHSPAEYGSFGQQFEAVGDLCEREGREGGVELAGGHELVDPG